MNNTEKFEKFIRLRKLFREYEAIKADKNGRIDEIQELLVPGELKENFIKEYKAVIDPKIEKVEDDIFRLIDDGSITCVLDLEDAIRYRSEKRDDILVFVDNGLDIYQQLKRSDVEEAIKVCGSGPCGHRECPLRSIPGCTTILAMYRKGKYDRMVKIKEE